MTALKLLPEFEEAIRGLREPDPWSLPIRPDARQLSEQIRLIEEADEGERLLAQLNRLPIGAVAIGRSVRLRSTPNLNSPTLLSTSVAVAPGKTPPPCSR